MAHATPELKHADSAYGRWSRGQGIDVIPGFHIPDLLGVPLKPWRAMGGSGCFINHDGSETSNDCYLVEIPAAGGLLPRRHLHEVMIYVLRGRGSTVVRSAPGEDSAFEWSAGALFSIPLNVPYQHFNGSGEEPARLLVVTNEPVVINLFDNSDFVFSCVHDFAERYDGAPDYFDGSGSLTGRVWETNFVPDVRTFELVDYAARGAGGTNIQFRLAHNTMRAHVSQFPVGTYKKAHRHTAGAHLVILSGTGYSLMWREGEPIQRYDWSPGALVIPPDMTFHQHFNTGPEPARYLALRHLNAARDPVSNLPMSSISTRLGGDQIEYEDEEPIVREMFEESCRAAGVEPRMDDHFKV